MEMGWEEEIGNGKTKETGGRREKEGDVSYRERDECVWSLSNDQLMAKRTEWNTGTAVSSDKLSSRSNGGLNEKPAHAMIGQSFSLDSFAASVCCLYHQSIFGRLGGLSARHIY